MSVYLLIYQHNIAFGLKSVDSDNNKNLVLAPVTGGKINMFTELGAWLVLCVVGVILSSLVKIAFMNMVWFM